MEKFKLGQTVYHRSVYEHKEPLKIVGILEDKLFLEGDFLGVWRFSLIFFQNKIIIN